MPATLIVEGDKLRLTKSDSTTRLLDIGDHITFIRNELPEPVRGEIDIITMNPPSFGYTRTDGTYEVITGTNQDVLNSLEIYQPQPNQPGGYRRRRKTRKTRRARRSRHRRSRHH